MTQNIDDDNAESTIGVAHMLDDGTLILELRAVGRGVIGDGRLVYPTTAPAYAAILKHLGDMKPGEHKSVLPFPDKFEDVQAPARDILPPSRQAT